MRVDRYGWDSAEILLPVTLHLVKGVRKEQRWGLVFLKLFFISCNNIFVITNVIKTFLSIRRVGVVSLM